jgi:uncharacterized protein
MLAFRPGRCHHTPTMTHWIHAALAHLVLCGMLSSLTSGRAASNAAPDTPRIRCQSIQFIEFEDIIPADGLLRRRASRTFDLYKAYTPDHVLTLNYSTKPSDKAFPGDTIGRYILSASLLARALHQPEPETLQRVMAALPAMLNSEGYLGWVLPPDRADETGLANIMWSNGLTEYYLWKKDRTALELNHNIFQRIILPVRDAYYYYYSPERTDGKIKWVHCTGDTAQAFGIIDPATRGAALFPGPELKEEINELIRLDSKIDHVKIQAQIHAVLFTTRGILRWYEAEGHPEHLKFAERLYRQYRELAMTENYENYNWFGRPEWTEGCAIVDSFTVAVRLWRLTGKPEYLQDAQLILFNGLLANQKGGDFGVNNCVGPNSQIFLKPGSPAPWCCSVWGGKGFARAIQYSYFQLNDGLMVTIPGNSTVTAHLPDGLLTLQQTTGYPHENGIRFDVLASESKQDRRLEVFMPPWIRPDSLAVNVNGQKAESATENGFLVVKRAMGRGDIITVQFQQAAGSTLPLYPERSPGLHRYMHGPLVLGVDTTQERTLPRGTTLRPLGAACYQAEGVTLRPICDLIEARGPAKETRSEPIQVLFRD